MAREKYARNFKVEEALKHRDNVIIKTSRLTLYLIDDSLTPLKLGMPLDIPQGAGQIVPKPMAW